jgi:hypothetical protein
MNSKYLIAILTVAAPCAAIAQGAGTYQCSMGELQRRVEILTEPGRTVPCEVHYFKDTEAPGEKQVLWSAASEAGYCERKAEEFVAKLESWGWDCGGGDMPAEPEASPAPAAAPEPDAAPEAPEADDTEVLTPAAPPE